MLRLQELNYKNAVVNKHYPASVKGPVKSRKAVTSPGHKQPVEWPG